MKRLTRRLYSAAGGSRRDTRSTSPPRKRGDSDSTAVGDIVRAGSRGIDKDGLNHVHAEHIKNALDGDALSQVLASQDMDKFAQHSRESAASIIHSQIDTGAVQMHRGAWQQHDNFNLDASSRVGVKKTDMEATIAARNVDANTDAIASSSDLANFYHGEDRNEGRRRGRDRQRDRLFQGVGAGVVGRIDSDSEDEQAQGRTRIKFMPKKDSGVHVSHPNSKIEYSTATRAGNNSTTSPDVMPRSKLESVSVESSSAHQLSEAQRSNIGNASLSKHPVDNVNYSLPHSRLDFESPSANRSANQSSLIGLSHHNRTPGNNSAPVQSTTSKDLTHGPTASSGWGIGPHRSSDAKDILSPVPPTSSPPASSSTSPNVRSHTTSISISNASSSSMNTEGHGVRRGHDSENDATEIRGMEQRSLVPSGSGQDIVVTTGEQPGNDGKMDAIPDISDDLLPGSDSYWPSRDYEVDQQVGNDGRAPSRGWSPSFTDLVNRKRKIITFNVGGQIFATSRETIANDEFCMLNVMLKHEQSMSASRDERGAIFIDRDPTFFSYVLNYLRNGIVDLPPERFKLNALLREAEFYQINGLYTAVQKHRHRRARVTREGLLTMINTRGSSELMLPNTDFSGEDLSHLSLTKGMFMNADLSEADMRFSDFERTRFSGSLFRCANLSNATLTEALLDGADLTGANLQKTQLYKADLKNACLRGCDLMRANLQQACLVGVDLRGAMMQGVILHGADLRNFNLEGSNMQGANLEGANMEGAILIRSNLKGANLWEANLRYCNLHMANLRDANIHRADMHGVKGEFSR